MLDLMEKVIAQSSARIGDLSGRLASGDIDLGQWQASMREELRRAHAMQIVAAAGGDRSAVDPNDWLKLGNTLKSQYIYLEDFAHQIKAGQLSDATIAARSQMYAGSSKVSYWAQVTRDAALPAQPGDHTTPCRSHCDCKWIRNADGSFTWELGTKQHCDVCPRRAVAWNPWNPDAPHNPALFMEAA